MFGEPMSEANATYVSNEEALVKLITDKTVDVVALVLGQPAKLLADMKPEARQHIKLLKFDPNHPASKAALKTYFPATVRASSYPNLLAEDLPGLAVKAFLVTYDFNMTGAGSHLRQFARSLCKNFRRRRCKKRGTRSGARSSWLCLISVAGGSTMPLQRVRSVPASLEARRNLCGRQSRAHSRNGYWVCANRRGSSAIV